MDRRGHGWQLIDLAGLGSNSGRSYAVALCQIILYPLAFTVLLVATSVVLGPRLPAAWAPIDGLLLQFAPIVIAGAATMHAVVRSHRRPWRSVIAPDLAIDWRRLIIGLGAQLAILAGELALVQAVTKAPWRLAAPAVPPIFLIALLLIPLQAASEEIFFRGYLTQALGRILTSRLAIILVVGLAFGLLHFTGHGPLTIPYFFVFSLIFSLVSLRDERLELAIGSHAATNLFGFAVGNLIAFGPGIVGGGPDGIAFNAAAFVVLIVNGLLFYGTTRLLVRVFCKPRPEI